MPQMHRAAAFGLVLALALCGCAHEGASAGTQDAGGASQASTPTKVGGGDAASGAAAGDTKPAGAAADAGAYGPENLMNPNDPKLNEKAPDVYRVRMQTTAGPFVIEVTRAWSPNGADRFYNLVRNGFFDDTYFFRAIGGFMAQFGLPADPKVAAVWRNASIMDDPATGHSNTPGMVTFAKTGAPNSRSTQLFINFGNNGALDPQGFTPIGKVVEGMESVNAIHTGYGESRPGGNGPTQPDIQMKGSAYLAENFPKLTRIEHATIVDG